MGTALRLPVCALLAVQLASTVAAQATEPVVRAGTRFTVELLPGPLPDAMAQAFATEALAVLEPAWPVFEKAVVPRSPAPATLRLHGDEAAFRAVEKRLQPAALPNEVCVAADGSEAHVLILPVGEPALRLYGLPPATKQQLLFAAGKQLALRQLGERANDWVAELVAIGLTDLVVNPQRKPGVDLLWDARRSAVLRADQAGVELLAVLGEVQSANDRDEFLGCRSRQALLAGELSVRAVNWAQRLLAAWPATAKGDVSTQFRYGPIEAQLGKEWKKTQERFAKQWKGGKLPWEVADGAIWRRGDDWVLAGTEEVRARLCGHGQLPAADWVLRCRLQWDASTVRSDPAIWLDHVGRTMLQVVFTPHDVRLLEVDDEDPEGRLVASRDLGLGAGKPIDVVVEATGKRLTVELAGQPAFDQSFPSRPLRGSFAFTVGATALQVGGVTVTGKPAKK